VDQQAMMQYIHMYIIDLKEITMMEVRVAKLFKNGASQAVRLPAEFRFDGTEVYVSRDELTGDVVLSNRPSANAWDQFFALLSHVEIPEKFMADRPLNRPLQEAEIFDTEVDNHSKKTKKKKAI
jgi:antitoxin VapB